MKHILLPLFLILFVLSSCDKDETIVECNIENPLEELEWMQEIVDNDNFDCYKRVDIIQATYKGATVFYYYTICPVCNSKFPPPLLDCNGETVKEYAPGDVDRFYKEVKKVKTIYSSCDE